LSIGMAVESGPKRRSIAAPHFMLRCRNLKDEHE
jgi:hypothetical protein